MAVINADHIETSASRIVVGAQQLQGINHIPADAVLGRRVLRTTSFEHAPRFSGIPDQESAALLREVVAGVPFDVADDADGDLDYVRSSQ